MYILLNSISSSTVDVDTRRSLFESLFSREFLLSNLKDHIQVILKALCINTAAHNVDKTHPQAADFSSTYGKYSTHVEVDPEDPNILAKAAILLTEFFTKVEKLRYFDASTFCIDKVFCSTKQQRVSLKMFADALLESAYIHMNILGHELINEDDEFVSMDLTRVSKNNIDLIKDASSKDYAKEDSEEYRHNPYFSSSAVINLFVSLAYCIQITVDSMGINRIQYLPFNNSQIRRSEAFWTITKRYIIHLMYMNDNLHGIYNESSIDSNKMEEIESIRISERLKLLTYGLHLKIWYDGGYYIFTNYNAANNIVSQSNGNSEAVYQMLSKYYTVSEPYQMMPLFSNELNGANFILPNRGLALGSMAGSYSILSNLYCLSYYLNDNLVNVNLVHHGFKDILVGDSVSSIYDERRIQFNRITTCRTISCNNVTRLQRIIDAIGTCKYHEIALASNINYLYRNCIKPYFANNQSRISALSNAYQDQIYDNDFFKSFNESCGYPLAYDCSFGYKVFQALLSNESNLLQPYLRLLGRMITIHRSNCINYRTWHIRSKDDDVLNEYYKAYHGFELAYCKLWGHHNIDNLYMNPSNGIFNIILRDIYTKPCYTNKYALGNLFGVTDARFGFSDLIFTLTAGGSILSLYEDPMMLAIYNNIDCETSNCLNSIPRDSLFTFTMDMYSKVYLTMKRLILELEKDANLFESIKNSHLCSSLEEAKYIFYNDHKMFNASTKNDYASEIHKFLRNVNQSEASICKFATSFGSFMDYDYICHKVIKIFDGMHSYELYKNADRIRFLNDMMADAPTLKLFIRYASRIEDLSNQYNHLINSSSSNSKDVPIAKTIASEYNSSVVEEKRSEELISSADSDAGSSMLFGVDANTLTSIIASSYNKPTSEEKIYKGDAIMADSSSQHLEDATDVDVSVEHSISTAHITKSNQQDPFAVLYEEQKSLSAKLEMLTKIVLNMNEKIDNLTNMVMSSTLQSNNSHFLADDDYECLMNEIHQADDDDNESEEVEEAFDADKIAAVKKYEDASYSVISDLVSKVHQFFSNESELCEQADSAYEQVSNLIKDNNKRYDQQYLNTLEECVNDTIWEHIQDLYNEYLKAKKENVNSSSTEPAVSSSNEEEAPIQEPTISNELNTNETLAADTYNDIFSSIPTNIETNSIDFIRMYDSFKNSFKNTSAHTVLPLDSLADKIDKLTLIASPKLNDESIFPEHSDDDDLETGAKRIGMIWTIAAHDIFKDMNLDECMKFGYMICMVQALNHIKHDNEWFDDDDELVKAAYSYIFHRKYLTISNCDDQAAYRKMMDLANSDADKKIKELSNALIEYICHETVDKYVNELEATNNATVTA